MVDIADVLSGELTFSEMVTVKLLEDAEKYQEDLLAIPIELIASTVRKIGSASDEYSAGLEVLQNRAVDTTSLVLAKTDEYTDERAAETSSKTRKANNEASTHTTETVYITERFTSYVLTEVNTDISEKLDKFLGINSEIWLAVGIDISKMHEDLDSIQNDFPGFIAEQTASLLFIPLSFLFDLFMNAFFEEE